MTPIEHLEAEILLANTLLDELGVPKLADANHGDLRARIRTFAGQQRDEIDRLKRVIRRQRQNLLDVADVMAEVSK